MAVVLHRLAAPRQERRRRLRRRRLDVGQRDGPPCILGVVRNVLLHRDRHVCDISASRGLSDRCGIPALGGGDRLGFQRRRASIGISWLDGIIGRRPSVLFSYAVSFGGNSTGLFCLPVPNSKIFRSTPGAMAEIGLTRSTGWPGVPTTS